eukprot:11491463-Ditylum_brightwellii.AAC.1
MTRKEWRIKTKQNKGQVKKATTPGQVVSVDQLESTTPGFVVQLKGILTIKRYKAATVLQTIIPMQHYICTGKSML